MKVIAVIPARYGSTRFPGKPLAAATGQPMIQHVVERVRNARKIDRCIVATDDERIRTAVAGFGGEAVMTRSDHVSGTDRIAEVIRGLPGGDDDVVLNVQGDEPELNSGDLDRLVERITAPTTTAQMATLACPFPADGDWRSPNTVKVVLNRAGEALYFSRSVIPYERDGTGDACPPGCLLHLGVYAFRRALLLRYAELPAGVLENIERLEQLRVLENGLAIAVEVVSHASVGIDTPQDYEQFVARYLGTRQ